MAKTLNVSSRALLEWCLENDGVFGYPTEAVFGLGCNPWSEVAVTRLLALKQRDWRKGLIVVASDMGQIKPLLESLDDDQLRQLNASWPGHHTWCLPNHNHYFPQLVTGQQETIAVRISAHPIVKSIVDFTGYPIISTSANIAGRPPALTHLKCLRYFGADFPVIPGALGGRKSPSCIKDITTGRVVRA